MRITVTGAGGALGGWLVDRLIRDGHEVRAVDIKPLNQWWQVHLASPANIDHVNLADPDDAAYAIGGAEWVYHLAADMGGIPWTSSHNFDAGLSVLITANMIKAALGSDVERFFYASSACVYDVSRQTRPDSPLLTESDAWPANPDHMYGMEKCYGERLCQHVTEDYGMKTRVARLHNVYGPHSSWNDGREKAPAAICRKVAEAKLTNADSIMIFGDGEQTRSFMYVDDFFEGAVRIMSGDHPGPINLGSEEVVSVNELARMVMNIAGYPVKIRNDVSAPQGVRGRGSDNTLIRNVLGWEPQIKLYQGLEQLYPWVFDRVQETLHA